jgi:septal ring factor EnvC (AmiA/AmiB activator)
MKKINVLLFLLLISISIQAQNREQLRIDQKKIENKIDYLSDLIQKTGKDIQQNVSKLALIERQINEQGSLIENLKLQNEKTKDKINAHLEDKNRLDLRFNELKEEYAKVLMSYAKTRNAYNDWMFILAADNFNSIYKRFIYLNQYADYRKTQAHELKETANAIQVTIDSIQIEKLEQERILNEQNTQLEALNSMKEQRLVVVNDIKTKQAELQKNLAVVEAKDKAVKAEVMKYIMEDRNERLKKEKVVEASATNNKGLILNTVFENAKGKLPWPVDKGVIVKRFGVYHPANMSNITLRNDGIDIQTVAGADVKAVFKGKVIKIVSVPGMNQAVLIQQGDYYVLYSNLKYLNVKLGSTVEMGQKLGKVYGASTEENTAILKFQVWKNQDKLNPEKWLSTGKK